jgi:hypothetical protein
LEEVIGLLSWSIPTKRLIVRGAVTAIFSLIVGGTFWALAFHFCSSKDYSQENTVGVITNYGWPFKGISLAPGYAWNQFDVAACEWDYWLFVGLAAAVLALLQVWIARANSPKSLI